MNLKNLLFTYSLCVKEKFVKIESRAHVCSYFPKLHFINTILVILLFTTFEKLLINIFFISEAKLHYKTMVSQLVLLFSKLQLGIIKSLPATGLFPCNPPLSPAIYANGNIYAVILMIYIDHRVTGN